MRRTAIILAFGLVAVTGGGEPAAAVGTISGLDASPPSVVVGNSVRFTVRGTGTCTMSLDFGDGSPPAQENDAAMPWSFNHVYPMVGPQTATLTFDPAECPASGPTQITVPVRPRPGIAPPERGPLQYLHPTIVGVLGWGVQPGTPLILGGAKFGDQQGTVRLLGGDGSSKSLRIEEWYDDGIGGFVPDDIHDICVFGVQVETAAGEFSNVKNLNVPAVVKPLPWGDAEVVSCGDDGDYNRCLNTDQETEDAWACTGAWLLPFGSFVEMISSFDEIQPGEARPEGHVGPSLGGSHRNCWGAIADDADEDHYRITLRNGWVLDSARFSSAVITSDDDDEGSTDPPSGTLPAGFVEGASSWEPKISWEVSPADTIAYALTVFIRGPACTSHK